MKLMKNTTSPYARTAHAMLIEAEVGGIDVQIVNPWADEPDLLRANKAARVPTLILDDGTVLTEALVIAGYARQKAPAGSHLKTPGVGELSIAGLGFGVIDAAVYVMTGRKIISDDLADPEFDSHPVAERRRRTMITGLEELDGRVSGVARDRAGLDAIAVIVASDYARFRFPDADWLPATPNIDALQEALSARPSLSETAPH